MYANEKLRGGQIWIERFFICSAAWIIDCQCCSINKSLNYWWQNKLRRCWWRSDNYESLEWSAPQRKLIHSLPAARIRLPNTPCSCPLKLFTPYFIIQIYAFCICLNVFRMCAHLSSFLSSSHSVMSAVVSMFIILKCRIKIQIER